MKLSRDMERDLVSFKAFLSFVQFSLWSLTPLLLSQLIFLHSDSNFLVQVLNVHRYEQHLTTTKFLKGVAQKLAIVSKPSDAWHNFLIGTIH